MKKQSVSDAGLPESDAEWRTWEEAQRALKKHVGEDEEGHSEYDPSVWMMGKHAPSHEKYQNRSLPDHHEENEEEEWNGPVICPNCAYYNEYGEGDPEHAEKFERGMERIWPNRVALACSGDEDCHESGTCAVCGDEINEYGPHGPEGHRMAVLGDSSRGGSYRVAGAISRASDTVWR
jgi:hypothetical protein